MADARAGNGAGASCCGVVELRRYLLHPGARETLIDLFDGELVEPQEEVGMRVIAQFRDLDRPDVFTWLRGFPDLATRTASLRAFYEGPVWARHRDAANATMIDSDDVRMLRPIHAGAGLPLTTERPARNATAIPPGLIVASLYTLAEPAAGGFSALFERTAVPRLAARGAMPLALLETEPGPNGFPRLPVREGEHAFVWLARFDDPAAHARHLAALDADPAWRDEVYPALARHFAAPPERWRLTPTARSRALG